MLFKTTLPQFKKKEFSVRRRYKDFAWLRNHLKDKLDEKGKRLTIAELPGNTFGSLFGWSTYFFYCLWSPSNLPLKTSCCDPRSKIIFFTCSYIVLHTSIFFIYYWFWTNIILAISSLWRAICWGTTKGLRSLFELSGESPLGKIRGRIAQIFRRSRFRVLG